jgi:hypothetical protein
MSPSSLTITLQAIAAQHRALADAADAAEAARTAARRTASLARLCAAAEAVPDLSATLRRAVAELAEACAAGDWERTIPSLGQYPPLARQVADGWATDHEWLALQAVDPECRAAAEARQAEIARDAAQNAATRAESAARDAVAQAQEEARAAASEKDQLTLARLVWSETPEVLDGWEKGLIREPDLIRALRDRLAPQAPARIPDEWSRRDDPADYERVERVSVPAYQSRNKILAQLATAAKEILDACGLPGTATCERMDYWTREEEYGAPPARHYTADLVVALGKVIVRYNNVILT